MTFFIMHSTFNLWFRVNECYGSVNYISWTKTIVSNQNQEQSRVQLPDINVKETKGGITTTKNIILIILLNIVITITNHTDKINLLYVCAPAHIFTFSAMSRCVLVSRWVFAKTN